MSETKAVRVAHVKYVGEYTLRLRWVNGKTVSVDLREPVHRLKGMRPLAGFPSWGPPDFPSWVPP
jgi:hypothetical protein